MSVKLPELPETVEERDGAPLERARIYLKSGASFAVDYTKMTIRRSQRTGDLVGLLWVTPDGAKYELGYVRLDEVAAVVYFKVNPNAA